jgi:hypothetical protein
VLVKRDGDAKGKLWPEKMLWDGNSAWSNQLQARRVIRIQKCELWLCRMPCEMARGVSGEHVVEKRLRPGAWQRDASETHVTNQIDPRRTPNSSIEVNGLVLKLRFRWHKLS